MTYKKVRIAVLMYGQVRTGVYCAPWIKEWFNIPEGTPLVLYNQRILGNHETSGPEPCTVEVDYFLDLKDRNNSTNTVGDDPSQEDLLTFEQQQQIIDIYKPKKINFTNGAEELTWRFGHNLQHYASMFNSIYTCMMLKKQHEIETGQTYDFCFTHRYDTITGPGLDGFKSRMMTDGIPPLSLVFAYSGTTHFRRWQWEHCRLGPNDIFFGGDNLAMEMLMADISRILFVNDNLYMSATEWGGPNIVIGRSINNCSIEYQSDIRFIPAVVRKNADLSRNVFENWQYHQHFWVHNHSANSIASSDKIE
jgi:hypothetical protein